MSTYREKAENGNNKQPNAQTVDTNRKHIYLDFYGLDAPPFSITPDPEFLFLSKTHNSVIEKILYGINSRLGFILLIGEVGTGKTTICRTILDNLEEWASTVYIINPSYTGVELISGILDDLGITYSPDSTKKELIDQLNRFLISTAIDKPVVIIIDDAQTMPMATLEDLRLLSNLETDKEKLLQMILVGQPELMDYLSRTELRQLRQRVAISCFLEYLSEEEIQGYIDRRLFVAGDKGNVIFTRKAKRKIARASRGIPRLINKICDYAMTAGYIADDFTIKPKYVEMAVNELAELDFRGRTHFKKDVKKPFSYRRSWMYYGLIPMMILSAFMGYQLLRDSGIHPDIREAVEGKVPASSDSLSPPADVAKAIAEKQDVNPPEKAVIAIENENSTVPALPLFSLQIGSYKYLDGARALASVYQKKNIEVHLNRVDLGEKGIWHRIFVGRFHTREQAEQFKTQHQLPESVILSLPWTILVDHADSPAGLNKSRSVLANHRYDCYATGNSENGFKLQMGVYPTQEEALKLADEINRLGLEAKVVLR